MDITPHVELLRALRQQTIKMATLIAELVDNSLDAAANHVEITVGPGRQIAIKDDGVGCRNIAAMLTLGGRQAHKSTKLGRYGIGLKDAALYLWGTTTIETVHKNELHRVSVNWPDLESSGEWTAADPETTAANGVIGTKITFTQITRNLPPIDPLLDELGYLFAPAILAGRQILLSSRNNRQPCVAYKLPPLVEVIETAFEVEGRGVKLKAGIVADNHPNKRSGFIIQHGHRSIITTAMGANGYSTSRIAGIVELDGKWALSKNKDDVAELEEELAAAIFDKCQHLLKKADVQARTLESAALADEVSKRLTEALRSLGSSMKREKRNSANKKQEGTVDPKDSGKKRRRAAYVHDIEGSIERAARGGIRVEWSDALNGTIGEADLPGSRIKLNSTLPLLARLRREENADAIAILAFTVFVDKVRESNSHQRYLPTMDPAPFVETLGKVLSGIPDKEGTKVRIAS